MMDENTLQKIRQSAIVAVVTLESEEQAIPLGEALLAGGVDAIELTLRTEAALGSVKKITASLPEIFVGAGTVIQPRQVEEVQDAGANFAVAPGINPRVIKAAREAGLPFAPGVCTPTDVEMALENDCKVLKFFPAKESGGLSYLRSMAAPFKHLGVQFIPLGGVNEKNAREYYEDPLIIALGGSWIAPPDLIAAGKWNDITSRARQAQQLINDLK